MLDCWDDLRFDFQSILSGFDLEREWNDERPWRWFVGMVQGLLARPESLFRITLTKPPTYDDNSTDDEEDTADGA